MLLPSTPQWEVTERTEPPFLGGAQRGDRDQLLSSFHMSGNKFPQDTAIPVPTPSLQGLRAPLNKALSTLGCPHCSQSPPNAHSHFPALFPPRPAAGGGEGAGEAQQEREVEVAPAPRGEQEPPRRPQVTALPGEWGVWGVPKMGLGTWRASAGLEGCAGCDQDEAELWQLSLLGFQKVLPCPLGRDSLRSVPDSWRGPKLQTKLPSLPSSS